MEREILFRGFCPDEKGTQIAVVNGKEYKGDWVEGFYAEEDNLDPVQVLGEALGVVKTVYKKKEVTPCIIDKEYGEWRPILPETVGQFTGLTDKNGKKIYEGDYAILKDSKGQMRLKCVYVDALCGYFWERSIYLNKRGWWFDRLDKFESHRNIEIIGNIHDKEECNETD